MSMFQITDASLRGQQVKWNNIKAADTLAPCIARPPTAMIIDHMRQADACIPSGLISITCTTFVWEMI